MPSGHDRNNNEKIKKINCVKLSYIFHIIIYLHKINNIRYWQIYNEINNITYILNTNIDTFRNLNLNKWSTYVLKIFSINFYVLILNINCKILVGKYDI